MAFLDNSGDIILDAVLTDLGRQRLAKGDGSFKITKFALGDDEIDYSNYNVNHASGSAYYDLEILQTPILEAFTNNSSTMKHMLISLSRDDIFYLPVIKINTYSPTTKMNANQRAYIVSCNTTTQTNLNAGCTVCGGLINGVASGINKIMVQQGLDTTQLSYEDTISSDLKETQYMIEIDNRLGSIYTPDKTFYYLTDSTSGDFVEDVDSTLGESVANSGVIIAGPRGTQLTFSINVSTDLQTGTRLFTTLGTSTETTLAGYTTTNTGFYIINSTIRVTGVTTGYRVDIPVKFVKEY